MRKLWERLTGGRRKQAGERAQDAEIAEDEFEDEDEDEDGDELDAIMDRVDAWGREWSESPHFQALTQEQKEEAQFVVESFAEYMWNYHDVAPQEWNTGDLEECCLKTLPRKITAEEVYFRSIAPVLASFFTFLGEKGVLSNAASLARQVTALSERIVRNSNAPRYWGMAKSVSMEAMKEGVDLTDEKAMNAFLIRYNARMLRSAMPPPGLPAPDLPPLPGDVDDGWPQVETFIRPGPKVGRNDLCPCGSGRKYKKCCGQ
jgi:hypothetical protein